MLTSNYFGDGKSNDTSKTTPKQSIASTEEQVSQKPDQIENRRLSWACSQSESSSDLEDKNQAETEGTFYFLDKKTIKNNIIVSDGSKSPEPRNRTQSVNNFKPTLINQTLLTSTIKEKSEVKMNEKSLKKVIWLVIHKAILIRTIAKILMISLPYKIDEDCNLIDGKVKLPLKPNQSSQYYAEAMKAYSLLQSDTKFLYRSVKSKLSKARYQGKMLELVAKVINSI